MYDFEDDEEEEEEEDEDNNSLDVHQVLNYITGRSRRESNYLDQFPKLSEYKAPSLDHNLVIELDLKTSAADPTSPSSSSAAGGGGGGKNRIVNPILLLRQREGSSGRQKQQITHFATYHRLPSRPAHLIDTMHSRGYIGQFTKTGDIFIAGFQNERRIKLYDSKNTSSVSWQCTKNVECRNLRWTVTDVALSPDQRFLLYSSISPVVHMVSMDTGHVESVANVTDIHEPLNFGNEASGIWSIRWSHDGGEIIAGTSSAGLFIYNVERQKSVVKLAGCHRDDVNAVAYLDDSCNTIITGSDDCYIKIWDRRTLGGGGGRGNDDRGNDESTTTGGGGGGGARSGRPVGVCVGHCEGITHMDSRNDDHHFISTAKDQTIKLWDIRMGLKDRVPTTSFPRFAFDYRWMEYPGSGRVVSREGDASIMTFRGASILSTLIRSYFSPEFTTGGRYVYGGSADGVVRIFNIVSGEVVGELKYHREVVRDCSWHPTQPLLVTTSFDGSVVAWEPVAPGEGEEEEERDEESGRKKGKGRTSSPSSWLPRPGGDQLGDW